MSKAYRTTEIQQETLRALKATLQALEAHLDAESARTNISRSGICPCEIDVVQVAKAVIKRAEGGAK